jgi:hypothetical protein
MNPLSKVAAGIKILNTIGIEYLKLVLKLYLSASVESFCSKTGNNCKKEHIGAYF